MGLTYRNQFTSAAQDARYGGDLDRVIDGWAETLSAELGSEEADDGGEKSGASSI